MTITAPFKIAATLMLALSLTSCATPDQDTPQTPPPPATAPSVARTTPASQPAQTIGLISGFGNQINFVKRGFTVFGNASSTGDITAWHIDQTMLDDLKADLPKNSVVTTQIVTFDQAQSILTSKLDSMLFGSPKQAIDALLANQTSQPALWVVVVPTCPYDGSSLPPGCGISLFHRPLIGMSDTELLISANVKLIDGATHKILSESELLIKHTGGGLIPIAEQLPAKELTDDFIVGQWSDYSDTQRETLHQDTLQLLNAAASHTLQKLNLTQ